MTNLNIITPWPPQRNGIADYSYHISQSLCVQHNIITEAAHPDLSIPSIRIFHPTDPFTDLLLRNGTNLFHFGNNPDHIFCVPLFLRYGGHVLIHDLSLHYLSELTDFLLPGFFERFLRQEQPQCADHLLRIWLARGKTNVDYSELHMLSWLEQAESFIVHSKYAKGIIAMYHPNSKIKKIPHFAYPRAMTIDKINRSSCDFRNKHNLGRQNFIISAVGFVSRNKLYSAIMTALQNLPIEIRSEVKFVIAGEKRLGEYDIHSEMDRFADKNNLIMIDWMDEDNLVELLAASDLVFNLRHPTFGESSGSVARALGCGSIVVVSNSGSYSELPDEICEKVSAGVDPTQEITSLILHYFRNRDRILDKRLKILRYASNELHPADIGKQFLSALTK